MLLHPKAGWGSLALCPSSFSGIGGPFGDVGCVLDALAGMELRCDGGNGELEIFKGVEALSPLSSYPLAVLGELGSSRFEISDWVVQVAMGFHQLVGVSCKGFEGQLLAILTAIEVEEVRRQQGLASTPKKRNKGSRELRGLEYSINYDSKKECSNRGKGRNGGFQFLL